MTVLLRELQNVQNPALGSILIWQFCAGYRQGSRTEDAVPVPVLFVVLPVLLQPDMASLIARMQKATGLRAFVDRFVQARSSKSDLVLDLHRRAGQMRKLTLRSVSLAIATGLLSLLATHGTVVALSQTMPRASIPPSVRPLLRAAEKLGLWCGDLSLHEVSLALKVAF